MQSSLRTIGLWVVLIILFVAFYNFFGTTAVERGWTSYLPFAVIFGVVLVAVLAGGGARKGAKLNLEGNTLLAQGRVAAALEKFEAARPLLKAEGVIPFNVGVCRFELWQLEAAEREFLSADSKHGLHEEVRRYLPSRLALVFAMRGQEAKALEQLEGARVLNPESDPMCVLAEAVLACRRGDWAGARALLEQPLTHNLGGRLRGLRDVLLAWSVERSTGERRYVDPVTMLGEASPDKLREDWPELVSFLLDRARQVA